MDWTTIIASFIAAVMGSVIGPIVQQRLSFFADVRKSRRNKIKIWKDSIKAVHNPQPSKIKNMSSYREYRLHLTPQLRDAIENTSNERDIEFNRELRRKIIDELTILENEWKLL